MHATDELITLTEATKHSPGRPSTNCVWRWCRKGVRARSGLRVRLRHVRVGGKIFTSRAWLEEFGHHVAEADAAYFDQQLDAPRQLPSPAPGRSESQRHTAIARAERSVVEAGLRPLSDEAVP